jgi:hypothetical protein
MAVGSVLFQNQKNRQHFNDPLQTPQHLMEQSGFLYKLSPRPPRWTHHGLPLPIRHTRNHDLLGVLKNTPYSHTFGTAGVTTSEAPTDVEVL